MKLLDVRLLPVAIALWIGAACGLHLGLHPLLLLPILVFPLLANVEFDRRKQAMVWLISAMVGMTLAALRVDAASPEPIADAIANAGVVRFVAVVDSEPRAQERRGFGGLSVERVFVAHATLLQIDTGARRWRTSLPVTLQWKSDGIRYAVGAYVSGQSIPRPDDVASRSAYWLRVQGQLRIDRRESRGAWLATRIREGLARATNAQDGGDGAALLPGLVLGDTRAQSSRLVDDLRASGLSHLTAVSGANLAIVIAAVMWLLQRTRIRARHRHVILLIGIAAFVAVVQPQPSVVRAAMMGAISVVAVASGARRASSSTLWLSVVLLLLVDPFLAWQWGFVLSVAATAGLIVLSPRIVQCLGDRWWGRALAVTLSAQLATFPVLLAMGRPPTWLSIPANLVCEPLVAPATVSGFLAAVLAAIALVPVPGLSAVASVLAGMTAWPGVRLAGIVAWIAHRGVATPLAVAPVESLTGLLAVLGAGWLLWRWGVPRRSFIGLLGLWLAFSIAAPDGVHRWPQRDWWYAMCDVGQGDSTVLNVGNGVVVIDAGPDPVAERRCLRLLRVRHVVAFIATHFHADHVEGVSGLVQQARVDAAYATPLHEPAIEASRTQDALGAALQPLQAGDRLQFGDTTIAVLWPEVAELTGEPNNGSLVLDIERGGVHILVTGDADPAAQAAMRLPVSGYAILKVPHHASKYQDPAFIARVQPGLALVSVGEGNDYGHPAQSTIDAYRAQGVRVLRSDRDGAISVAIRHGSLSYATLSH